MINSKELLEMLRKLLAKNEEDPFSWSSGYGIITEQVAFFDKATLEENKSKIAKILVELGIDECPILEEDNLNTIAKILKTDSLNKIAEILIEADERQCVSLERLTKLKNGKIWNELQTKEDFLALELLIACSDACGFIINDTLTIQRNNLKIGEKASILTSQFGKRLIDGINDEWLQILREDIIKKMHFPVDIDKIHKYANFSENSSNQHLTI